MQLNKRRRMQENNMLPSHGRAFTGQAERGVKALARRILTALIMMGVLTGLVALVASSPEAVRAGSAAPQMEGTWRVTSSIADGPPPFSALYSFSGGGTLQETDEIQLLTPSAGPALGTWTKVGSNQYAFTWESFLFDLGSDSTAGRLQVRGVVTLTDKDTYTAVDQFSFYDTDGNVTLSGCATEEATRMTVEPVTSCPGPTESAKHAAGRSRPAKGWKN